MFIPIGRMLNHEIMLVYRQSGRNTDEMMYYPRSKSIEMEVYA